MTMLPGQPRRPRVPPLPEGWTRVTREASPASWSGLPRSRQPGAPGYEQPPPGWRPADAQPLPLPAPTSLPSVSGLPELVDNIGATVKAQPQGALARLLRGQAKVIAVVIGMVLTVLTLIDGLGFVPKDARDIVAILFAALTPIAVALIPEYRPPKGRQ